MAEGNGYTKFPNWLLDEALPNCDSSEWAILCAVVRTTTGWGKESEKMSIADLSQLTGIRGRQNITRAVKSLLEMGYLGRIQDGQAFFYFVPTSNDSLLVTKDNQSRIVTSASNDSLPEVVTKSNQFAPILKKERKLKKEEEEIGGGDLVTEIERHFTQTTGIMPTRSNWQSDWKMPIELWLKADDVATIKDKIDRAWAVATDKGFRISSPRSLNNTMVNLRADRANGTQNGFVQTWQSLQRLMSSNGADNKPELTPDVDGLVRKMGGWSTLCRMDLFEAQNKMRSLYNGT